MRFLTSVFLFISLTVGFCSFCQNATIFPKIIPPSPEAQSFMRYGEYPVDYSTGVPNINIPLFQVTSGKLSLPVSISYHASGIKVGDVASVAGLGWKLSAGGLLSRTVLGLPDDVGYGILNFPYLTKSQIDGAVQNGSFWNQLDLTRKGVYDAESDRYYYSASDKLSGDFVYDNSFNIIPVTYSDNKIQRISTNVFHVLGEDGTKYIFDKPEYTRENLDPQFASSWWLTKIISADNIDVIEFQYETQVSPTAAFTQTQSLTLTQAPGTDAIFTGGTATTTYQVLLKKILFNDGSLTFDYVNDRKDMQSNRLTTVSIFNKTDVSPIRKFQFIHSYFYSGVVDDKYNYRLRLDQLKVYDGNNENKQNYTFEYDQQYIMPPYIRDGIYANPNVCYGIDYHGYFNGETQNQHLISNIPALYVPANRNANFSYSKTCILKKINFPTGGSTAFEYEINEPGMGAGSSLGGGLRIHKIISKSDANSVSTTKRYEYVNNLLTTNLDVYGWNVYETHPIVFNSSCTYLTPTYTVYMANPILAYSSFRGSPVLYQNVDEYIDGGVNNSFKNSYVYGSENDLIVGVNFPRYLNQYYIERPWRKGQLMGINTYKLLSSPPGTPSYSMIKSTAYAYSDYRVNTIISGTKVQRIHEVLCGSCSNSAFCYDAYISGSTYSDMFYYFDTQIQIGIKKLTSETVTEIDGNGNTVTRTKNTNFTSPYHLFPTSISTINSKGENQSETLKYSHDFTGTATYDAMIAKNIISPVVEQLEYKNSSLLRSTKTNYGFWNGTAWISGTTNIIVPQTVESKILANSPEVKIRYHSYDDKANLTTISKENDVKKTYLWGYGKSYPVAEITGADYATASSYVDQSVLDNLLSTETQIRNELNNIRIGLANTKAQVTTYTYKPLVGKTSQTDPNGKTIYYEYDAFNRLKLIRDQDNNILKRICYNYYGQVEDCTANCTNTSPNWQNTSTPLRCKLVNNVNTGWQEQEQIDQNPCSSTYGQVQWVQAVYNPAICPPPGCSAGNCSGDTQKCVNGVCETGVLKIISTRRQKTFPNGIENPFVWVYYCTSVYCFSDGSSTTPYEYQTSGLCTVQICQ